MAKPTNLNYFEFYKLKLTINVTDDFFSAHRNRNFLAKKIKIRNNI